MRRLVLVPFYFLRQAVLYGVRTNSSKETVHHRLLRILDPLCQLTVHRLRQLETPVTATVPLLTLSTCPLSRATLSPETETTLLNLSRKGIHTTPSR